MIEILSLSLGTLNHGNDGVHSLLWLMQDLQGSVNMEFCACFFFGLWVTIELCNLRFWGPEVRMLRDFSVKGILV